MNYDMVTKNGYNFYDISSMLQKSIRRGDMDKAGFALKELLPKYANYVWKRLIVYSAEDCYGIITKEIMALKEAYDFLVKSGKGKESGHIFAAKAVVLLCLSKKNRDACYVACNFMDPDRTLSPDEITDYIDLESDVVEEIPDYVFDCHTMKGKRMGKDILDMIIEEQNALAPKQISFFDNGDWNNFIKNEQANGNLLRPDQQRKIDEFQKGKVTDPTNGGKNL